MEEKKIVYLFEEGNKQMRDLLGGKGANLAEMSRLGLPVPPGFIITTEACINYYREGRVITEHLKEKVEESLSILEEKMGRELGDPEKPLLLSVRSGAVISMPGMMDTVLNLGLNEETVEGLAKMVGDRRFALDCYRRFIQMYGDVVLKVEGSKFEHIIEEEKEKRGVSTDVELDEEALKVLIDKFKNKVEEETGAQFPQDPREQLFMAIRAVFDSWHTPRAQTYRDAHNISDDLGTAVNVQTMVFGNQGNESGTGVVFTRSPSTGENEMYGEYLLNAQGEDVVAGIRTPESIGRLRETLPQVYDDLVEICRKLENHYQEMQDIEFTIEGGKLYLLQTRSGKRAAAAAVKIAVDMAREGIIDEEEAVRRVKPENLEQLLHRQIDPSAEIESVAVGLPASPGAACGEAVFDADSAAEAGNEGRRVILVRTETTPDDIHGMIASEGVLTSRGGMTSHAAVVARGMGKPCVSGCEALRVDEGQEKFEVNGHKVSRGDIITINGSSGEVILGEVPMKDPEIGGDFQDILEWADRFRTLKVRANADTPEDARQSIELGAEGIGLCRTEHMFFSSDRLPVVQEMILADKEEDRKAALEKLLPYQREDFKGIFREMAGYPVTIRLLDPPLHEFLPDRDNLLAELYDLRQRSKKYSPHKPFENNVHAESEDLQQQNIEENLKSKEDLWEKVNSMHEFNPMLGQRGCRLGLVYPEIYQMQVRAILQAGAELVQENMNPKDIQPEIMIPLVGHEEELRIMKELISQVVEDVKKENDTDLPFLVGTMIELPRSCIAAGEISNYADFFSFGTNDLTQTTFGFSRDDAEGKFLPYYLEQGILPQNPFMQIDQEGVGKLVQMAVERSQAQKPDIKLGICGEHGGDPESIHFFHNAGLEYVSCSPFRIPVARLAAAQATFK